MAKAATLPADLKLRAGQSLDLLKALHILTADGKLNQDSRRKLKQVNHLLQFIAPLLPDPAQPATLVDHGAGKSYLGFLLYDAFLKAAQTSVISIETRADLVAATRALAQQLGFTRMQFLHGTAAQVTTQLPAQIDLITALHACDTATDEAIALGLQHRTQALVLVPCCQAELAAQLRQQKNVGAQNPLAELWRRPLHTREFGSQLTNVLRCLQLEAAGYQVTVTELVGWEHSMKNELIIAQKITGGHPQANAAREKLSALLSQTGLVNSRFSPSPHVALAN